VVQEQNVILFSTDQCVTAQVAGAVIHKSSATDVSGVNLFQTGITTFLYSIFVSYMPQLQPTSLLFFIPSVLSFGDLTMNHNSNYSFANTKQVVVTKIKFKIKFFLCAPLRHMRE
jgi:hypothetical protein